MKKLGIGLYGHNGHQIQNLFPGHSKATLIGIAEFADERLPESLKHDQSIVRFDSLEAMIRDDRIDLISLCSPTRADQTEQAVRCMQAGKHVYAEKPCAMTENDLDKLIDTSQTTGRRFHEMAGTFLKAPYPEISEVVRSGLLGEIVQVFVQKSYPMHNGRPQDERIDGGLIRQVGVHAFRMIEHVAGLKIEKVSAIQTNLGNPVADGGLQMASSIMATLENGAVASVVANYLNQKVFGVWSNEHLRIFGTKGFVESVDGGKRTQLVIEGQDIQALEPKPSRDYFDLIVDAIQGDAEMPFNLEDELHPTRMIIRAKDGVM